MGGPIGPTAPAIHSTSTLSILLATTIAMTAATDPDRLVFFLQGAHEDDCDGHCAGADLKTSSTAPGTPHNASILDNLARLLVSGEEKGQVFAIAVVPDTQRSRFIIAENKLVPLDVRRHLTTMLQSLYETRQLVLTYPKAQHSSAALAIPIPIPRDATDPVHRKLLELEVSVFRHSWPKLRRRFTKAHRDDVFTDICSAILSLDPDKRLPLSMLQQDGLSVLSQSDRKQLGVIRHIVNQIRVLLVPSTAPSDDVIHKMRVFLADMAQIMRMMESREVPLLRRFASYARTSRVSATPYAFDPSYPKGLSESKMTTMQSGRTRLSPCTWISHLSRSPSAHRPWTLS